MHTYRRILFVMKECEPDKEAEFAATFLHHFVGRRASYPTIEEINRKELNDVNNEVLMPIGSRLFRITAAVDEHPTTG